MVAAVQSTLGAPSVKRRKAVGISMVTGIFASLLLGGRVGSELVIEVGLEGVEAWGDGFRYRKFGSDGDGGFQSVASDGDHRRFLRLDAAFADELLGYARGYAACGFREDTFGFGEEFDSGDDFGVGNVFGPAATGEDQFRGVVAVGGVADGQRPGDGVGFLRLEAVEALLDRGGDGRTTCRLRTEELDLLGFDPAQRHQFAE